MSFLTSTLLNYWANRTWVFSNKFTWANLSKYFVLVGANLLVSMLIVFLATQNHLDASLAKFASMCVIVLINFFLLRRWVFRDPRM
jgi:putative flippase GtrA